MKPNYLTLILTLLTLTSFTQTQPQFKFWLAFEDSIGQRDTIWILAYDSLSFEDQDSIQTQFIRDTTLNTFQVYKIGKIADSLINTNLMASMFKSKSISFDILAQNYHLPITVRWDSSLLRNNGLPWEGVYGFLSNHFIFINIQFTPYRFAGLDKFNSIELLPFQQGGGIGNHFPLKLKITEENIYQVGVNQSTKSNSINIYPNPASESISIKINTNSLTNYRLLNINKNILQQGVFYGETNLNTSNLKPGIYLLQLSNSENVETNKIIIK